MDRFIEFYKVYIEESLIMTRKLTLSTLQKEVAAILKSRTSTSAQKKKPVEKKKKSTTSKKKSTTSKKKKQVGG